MTYAYWLIGGIIAGLFLLAWQGRKVKARMIDEHENVENSNG